MPGENVTYAGLNELNAGMKALGADMTKQLRKVEKDAARIVADEAKAIAPYLSGTLAGSVKPSATNSGAFVKSTGVVYAKPIVFGWARHNITPNPFIYKALDKRREEVLANFQKGVDELINKDIP